jgi:hypothetical protein
MAIGKVQDVGQNDKSDLINNKTNSTQQVNK